MLQVLIVGDTPQLILDYLLDILLDLVVVVLYGLLHTVVAIRIQEIVDDGEFLITTFLPFHLFGINYYHGMEYILLDTLVEVIGNRADIHSLGESANLARRNETVHLGIDGCRNILTVDGNRLALLEYFSKTLG